MREHVDPLGVAAPPRVTIVAGDAFTRSCLEELLVAQSGAVEARDVDSPSHVVVVDADSIGDGLRAVVRDEALSGRCMVIVGARLHPAAVRWCLERNVRAVVPKDASLVDMRRVIAHVARGGRHVPADLAALAVSAPADPLTERERHALRAVASGATSYEAAHALGVAQGTLRNLVSSALRKTGTRDRYSAASVAREAGWL